MFLFLYNFIQIIWNVLKQQSTARMVVFTYHVGQLRSEHVVLCNCQIKKSVMRDVSVLKALFNIKINVFLRNYVHVRFVIRNSKQEAKFKGIAIHGKFSILGFHFHFFLWNSLLLGSNWELWGARGSLYSSGKFQVDDWFIFTLVLSGISWICPEIMLRIF